MTLQILLSGLKMHSAMDSQLFRQGVAYIYAQKFCLSLIDMGKMNENAICQGHRSSYILILFNALEEEPLMLRN